MFTEAVDTDEVTCDIYAILEEEKKFVDLVELEKLREKSEELKKKEQELKLGEFEWKETEAPGTLQSYTRRRKPGDQAQLEKKLKDIPNELYTCQICNSGEYQDDNLIVFCSRCSVTVHMKCYGICELSENEWICELCHHY